MLRGGASACRQLEEGFKHDYAALWHGLVFADAAAIQAASERMHAGQLYPLLAAIITQKPWDQLVGPASDVFGSGSRKTDGVRP